MSNQKVQKKPNCCPPGYILRCVPLKSNLGATPNSAAPAPASAVPSAPTPAAPAPTKSTGISKKWLILGGAMLAGVLWLNRDRFMDGSAEEDGSDGLDDDLDDSDSPLLY